MNKIFLTVDTECHDIKKENQYIWGKKKDREYGIGRILELGKQHDIAVNFFVDFAEERSYGRDYIQRIVDKIKQYNQPIFLHLHPNFISGDERRTFLWEYSKDEQKALLEEGIGIYKELMGKTPSAFRAGRYGVDEETYNLVDELLPGIAEFSYTGGYGKMCHIGKELVNTVNHLSKYKSLYVMPNGTYVALDIFGKRKTVGIDVSEMSLTEFKEYLEIADGRDFVLTMHSWNFIDRYFWSKTHIGNHWTNERLFKGMIRLAKEYGYSFVSIDVYDFETEGSDSDIEYNACDTLPKKIRAVFINFWRFQQMAKISKKYFVIYFLFYFATIIIVLFILFYIRF